MDSVSWLATLRSGWADAEAEPDARAGACRESDVQAARDYTIRTIRIQPEAKLAPMRGSALRIESRLETDGFATLSERQFPKRLPG